MHAKQTLRFLWKKKFSPLAIFAYGLIVVASVALHPTTTFATGNCAGAELQGTGTKSNICFNPDGSTASDAPTGGTGTAPTGTTNAASGSGTATNTTTCAVEKIGWLVCPIMEQAAKISDKTFGVLADNFLSTDPSLVANDSGTEKAWEYSRNIANIMFIMAFLIIIVSQVTSFGISNYGLKKMIPRLLVAAILVNVSFYVCQLLVDITNIFGYQVEEALAQIANSIGPSVFGNAQQLGAVNVGNSWGDMGSVIVVGSLAVAGVVWLVMGPMMAVILLVLLTALSIIVILMLRKALIVLLIVVSPIAFVMYLLPNTEKLFTRWKDTFVKVLMVFPIIGMLFGAGQLASTVILVSGAETQQSADASKACNPDDIKLKKQFDQGAYPGQTGQPGDYDSCGLGSIVVTGTKSGDTGTNCSGGKGSACHLAASWTLGLVALGVAVAPLIAVWSVLKGALSAAGSIGGKIQANISKGGQNLLGKRMQALDENRQKTLSARALERGGSVAAFSQRRKMKSGLRDARLKAAQDMFEAHESNSDISNATREAQLKSSAAAAGAQKAFTQGLVDKSIDPSRNAGVYGQTALSGQFAMQQAKAVADAVKEAELEYSDQQFDKVTKALSEALAGGDKINARAMQNILFSRGAKGMEEYHKVMDNQVGEGEKGVLRDMRENIRSNHGTMTDQDKSIAQWANGNGDAGNTLADKFNDAGTWSGMTTAKLAGQKGYAQAQALARMSQPERDKIIDDLRKSPQDANRIDQKARSTWGF